MLRPPGSRKALHIWRESRAQPALRGRAEHPDAEAVVQGETRFTYAELQRAVARLAGGLPRRGCGAGDRLAAVVRCRHESVQLYWACQWLGATFVPLSPRVSAADIAYCREDSGAALFLEADAELEALVGDEHPGTLEAADERREPDALHLRARPGGRRACPARTAPTAPAASRRSSTRATATATDARRMPLYHTMGMHSLVAMHLDRRLLRLSARLGRRGGARS